MPGTKALVLDPCAVCTSPDNARVSAETGSRRPRCGSSQTCLLAMRNFQTAAPTAPQVAEA
eukprot:10970703-Heterocapsa_arctica.AAC.1